MQEFQATTEFFRERKMNNLLKNIAALVLGCGLMTPAGAAQVDFELYGYVDTATVGNAFGLAENDQVRLSGRFDDSVLAAGSGTISFGAGSGNNLSLTLGSITLTEINDIDYDFGTPELLLNNNAFGGFDFWSEADINGAPVAFEAYLDVFFSGSELSGIWDAGSFNISPVPVPAAVWLFGSGLLALFAGLTRSRRAH